MVGLPREHFVTSDNATPIWPLTPPLPTLPRVSEALLAKRITPVARLGAAIQYGEYTMRKWRCLWLALAGGLLSAASAVAASQSASASGEAPASCVKVKVKVDGVRAPS